MKNVLFFVAIIISVTLAQTPCQLYESSPLRQKVASELTVAEQDELANMRIECMKYKKRIDVAAERADRKAAMDKHRRFNAIYGSVVLGALLTGMVLLLILV